MIEGFAAILFIFLWVLGIWMSSRQYKTPDADNKSEDSKSEN